MDTSVFLAANTGLGFVSVYDGFPPEDCFLHIVKGGPGTGKSGYMKAIREAARTRGLDTLSVLCSGDPDSLDGLWIPALKTASRGGISACGRPTRERCPSSEISTIGTASAI